MSSIVLDRPQMSRQQILDYLAQELAAAQRSGALTDAQAIFFQNIVSRTFDTGGIIDLFVPPKILSSSNRIRSYQQVATILRGLVPRLILRGGALDQTVQRWNDSGWLAQLIQ